MPRHARVLQCFGLALILVAVASLIAPSMYHQIADGGRASPRGPSHGDAACARGIGSTDVGTGNLRLHRVRTRDQHIGMLTASSFFLVGLSMFYGLGYWLRRPGGGMVKSEGETPIGKKIEQLLTEARVMFRA
jgi:hypothetical protein